MIGSNEGSHPPARAHSEIGRNSDEQAAQRAAKTFVSSLHAAIRAIRLYPAENSVVQKTIYDLSAATRAVFEADSECTLRRVGDSVFVNDSRLRLTFDNYAAVTHVNSVLNAGEVGGIRVAEGADSRSWIVLLRLVSATSNVPQGNRRELLIEQLATSQINSFELLTSNDELEDTHADVDQRERSRRTYFRSLDATRDVMAAARLGKSPGLKRVKRAVQGIVDAILTDASSMLGLTALREFDDYTFVHSVNVCILSVALGRRIGLGRTQLLDLGLAALLHDLGKSRIPIETLNKSGSIDETDRALLRSHAWQGVLALFALPMGQTKPWRGMSAAFEHHMRIDGSGYPQLRAPRDLSIFSKIIAVADGYDAATTTRVYQSSPWSPADVLRGMRDNARLGLDPVIVKALINLTGIYPSGTLVVLDSFELALVMSASPDPQMLSRPVVRILSDAQGNLVDDPRPVDISALDHSGRFIRTIIRTENPDRYGIRIGDYFV